MAAEMRLVPRLDKDAPLRGGGQATEPLLRLRHQIQEERHYEKEE